MGPIQKVVIIIGVLLIIISFLCSSAFIYKILPQKIAEIINIIFTNITVVGSCFGLFYGFIYGIIVAWKNMKSRTGHAAIGSGGLDLIRIPYFAFIGAIVGATLFTIIKMIVKFDILLSKLKKGVETKIK